MRGGKCSGPKYCGLVGRIIEASELYGHSSYFRKKLKTLYYLEKIFSCKLKLQQRIL